ncbi:hypothetical protein PPTG_23826 [Phytophthora nicotianae INRA-310]|uniref:Uncharacterized protein n=1 Tax=Phytophthora nicotianae (strain INRA-310) TaxID=761204 RepID=W2PQL5_PHYN3|nr:hypothetical protein PPTG_23826 [Phytophthora nicotianae INRA-310]ETN02941.1 hypothetical protein PPTG_23826 [Phytophthora nicotianae INRA-310]
MGRPYITGKGKRRKQYKRVSVAHANQDEVVIIRGED